MRIRIEFDVTQYGMIYRDFVHHANNSEWMGRNPPDPGSTRYRTFVEIPDMPEVTEVKAEKVKEG